MKGVDIKVTGNKMVLTIDLSKTHGTSKTGNSETIASTGGNIDVPGKPGIKLGLNCYKPITS